MSFTEEKYSLVLEKYLLVLEKYSVVSWGCGGYMQM